MRNDFNFFFDREFFSKSCARSFQISVFIILILLFASSAWSQCTNATWRAGEGFRGFDGKIRATTLWDRDGAGGQPPVLVAAGSFSVAGTTFANNIALWNGIAWEPLGTGTPAGVNGEIYSLAVLPDNQLVAGGVFHTAGGVSAERIAKWNGESWSNLGTGLKGSSGSGAFALAVLPDGNLIAGGRFTNAGTALATNIAVWNGSSWSTVGTGIGTSSSTVLALTVRTNGNLIAAGSFATAGGTPAANIASWNGTTWSQLGLGLSSSITALANMPNGDLVAAGVGANVNGGSGSHVLRWNGTSWSGMSAGLYTGNSPSVLAMAVLPNGTLFAGGSFSVGTSTGSLNIASWNGTSWVGVGGGTVGSFILSLTALPNNQLVIGGNSLAAGSVSVSSIARWDGTNWNSYGSGFAGSSINAFAQMPNGDLMAGGSFSGAGIVEATGVARKTVAGWEAVGTGINNVRSLVVLSNGLLLASGSFLPPGSQVYQPLATWNGTNWTKFGPDSSPFPDIQSIAVMTNGDVVAGGAFTSIGGFPVTTVARWNNSTWSAIGTPMSGTVYATAVLANGDLIIGGEFDTAGGVPASKIARWNGTTWSPLGIGMNGGVLSLCALPNGDLLAGGRFGTAGGVVASRIARWNGSTWSAFGTGVSPSGTPYVNAITVTSNGDMIIGGNFSQAGSANTLSVAKWNGTNWSTLGGIGASTAVLTDIGGVNALMATPDGGFVMGGTFTAIDGNISRLFGQWGCPVDLVLGKLVIGTNGLKFSFEGVPGMTYGISYSSDLQTWQVIQSGLQGAVNYEDFDAVRKANPKGYYRVVEQ